MVKFWFIFSLILPYYRLRAAWWHKITHTLMQLLRVWHRYSWSVNLATPWTKSQLIPKHREMIINCYVNFLHSWYKRWTNWHCGKSTSLLYIKSTDLLTEVKVTTATKMVCNVYYNLHIFWLIIKKIVFYYYIICIIFYCCLFHTFKPPNNFLYPKNAIVFAVDYFKIIIIDISDAIFC